MITSPPIRSDLREQRAAKRRHPATRNVRFAEMQPPPVAFYALALTFAALVMLGLVMVLSASSITALHAGKSPWAEFGTQAFSALLGVIALTITYKVPYLSWRSLARPLFALSVVGMVLPLIPGLGVEVNGARAWIPVGGQQVQPSEFAKLALVIFYADLLTRRQGYVDDLRAVFKPCLKALLLIGGLTVIQGDLGSAMVVALIAFTMMFLGGIPLVPMALSGLVSVAGGLAAVLSTPYRRDRWTAFLDIEGHRGDKGYQLWQGIISIASGGPTGSGIGAGTGKWGYVPLAQSDFIFAILAEELGLVGVVAVIGSFALICYFGSQVALAAVDRFGFLAAAGIATWFAVQAAINIGGVSGLMPMTGLTLPFISQGGSSLFASMAAAGLLLNLARHART
jgi:cell division protein FtsW